MPQDIRVLKCFQCDLFQTDIVKKSNKWQCKVCQSKQSVRREYLRGSGPMCRAKAQELNMNGGIEETKRNNNLLDLLNANDIEEFDWSAIETMEETMKVATDEMEDKENEESNLEAENNSINFSQTQKWRRPIVEESNSVPKKSKWECYT